MTMTKAAATPMPHSWDLKSWESAAAHVWPHNEDRARLILRAHKAELQSMGALTRVGRNLVFLGAGYQKWLASQAPQVTEYGVPMNRPEHAAKRFGGRRGA